MCIIIIIIIIIILMYLKSIVFISANAVLNVTQFLFLLHTQTDAAL